MKRIIGFLRPFLWPMLFVLALTFGSAFADLNMPNYLSKIIDQGIANGDIPYIIKTGAIMLLFALMGIICSLASGFFSARVSAGFGRNLRGAVFAKVESFSMGEFDQFSTSTLITRTTNDIMQMQNFVMILLRIVLLAPIMCVGGIVMALNKSPELSKIIFIAMPIVLVLIYLISRFVMPLSKSMQKKLDRVNLVMREKLTGIRVIRAFNTEDFERKRFDDANLDLTDTTIKMQRTMVLLMPALMLVLNLTAVVLVWQGALQVSYGNIMVGDIIAITQYLMQIMMALTMFSMIFIMYPRAAASADRINEIMNTDPQIKDTENPVTPGSRKGVLEFRDVSFSYADADEPAISHVSFTAQPGQTTAIIGSTGSGKSALVNLIPRFYDPQEGEILIDGIPVKEYRIADLRKKIGYVPQKVTLFSGTIAENICFGNEDSTEERMIQAAKIAQAYDFIMEKERQFHAPVAQGGSNFSGGQKQRLAIARAIMRKPEIYIFDDSFSALDFKTDATLRKALAEETADATMIIVAQRVSTIMYADRILVLDEGQVVGQGTHAELLQNCEIYREIVESQLSAEEME